MSFSFGENIYIKMYLSLRICLISAVVFTSRATRLTSHILDFDTLNYDAHHIHQQHRRAIRSPNAHRVVLDLQAFGKDFQLQLKPDNSVLSNRFVLVSSEGQRPRHISDDVHFYEGNVVGVPDSHAHGSLRDGIFQGRFFHKDEGYSIEPATRYFDNSTGFHSVIYKDSHVVFPERGAQGCGLRKEMEERMNRKLDEAEARAREQGRQGGGHDHDHEDAAYRYKRQANNMQQTCDLHIITDHVFYNRHGDKNEILRQIGEHVQGVNIIYQKEKFGDDYDDVKFAVRKITVYESDENGNAKDITDPFSSNTIGVEKFLDITSDIATKDQNAGEEYCLVFAFTNRDFTNGVLGLAWIAERDRMSGGICGTAYNAGVVTTNNYGQDLSQMISILTFAHELGHSLGSRHDVDGDSTCSPGGFAGNYIMYAHASSGTRSNNDEFSSCSINSMSVVLNSLGQSGRRANCFEDDGTVSLCGNQIKEPNEDCDCGTNNECGDSCCNSMCQLNSVPCSPQQGPCCSTGCSYRGPTEMCANVTECAEVSMCNGISAECPEPTAKEDGISCDGGRKTCSDGLCTTSICEQSGKEECQCTTTSERCNLCCQDKGQPSTCSPFESDNGTVLMLNVGSPCQNFMGYCDIILNCQVATEDGPLATIFRALVPDFDGGPEEVQLSDAVLTFFMTYWWVVIIALLVLIGIMALIMFLCNFFTPTDNPWKEEVHNARRNRVSLRNRRDRGSHYPTSVPKDDAITAF